jgi:hypothetical protein
MGTANAPFGGARHLPVVDSAPMPLDPSAAGMPPVPPAPPITPGMQGPGGIDAAAMQDAMARRKQFMEQMGFGSPSGGQKQPAPTAGGPPPTPANLSPEARQALLQAMIARSRGGAFGAPAAPAAPGASAIDSDAVGPQGLNVR